MGGAAGSAANEGAGDPGADGGGAAGSPGSCGPEVPPGPPWVGPGGTLAGIAVVVDLEIPAGMMKGSLMSPPSTAVNPAPRVTIVTMLAAAICRFGRGSRVRDARRCSRSTTTASGAGTTETAVGLSRPCRYGPKQSRAYSATSSRVVSGCPGRLTVTREYARRTNTSATESRSGGASSVVAPRR